MRLQAGGGRCVLMRQPGSLPPNSGTSAFTCNDHTGVDQWSSGCAGKTMVNTAQIGFGHSNASWSTAASSAAGASGNNRPRRQNVQCTLRCGGPGIDIGRSEKEERKWRRERGSCQAAPHTNRPADTHWLRSTLRTQPCEGFEVIRAGAPHSPSCQRGALKLSQQQPLGLAAC